ncbi:MAG TPA: porin family protein [Chitinophagaceae bacterium]|nr:porin family protein [Chitinophagaceae bacterium]
MIINTRNLLLLGLLLAGSTTIHAQSLVGFKGGITVPNLEGNNPASSGYKSRLDVYGGIFWQIPLENSFYIQPELVYSPQGGKRVGVQEVPGDLLSGYNLPPGTTLYADFRTVTNLNYLELPVLGKFMFGRKIKYFVCAGPYVALLLGARTRTSGTSQLYFDAMETQPLSQNGTPLPAVDFTSRSDIRQSIKDWNFGAQGGVGLHYPLASGWLVAEGRVIVGITSIQKYPETDGKNQTGALVGSVGYIFNIK